MLEQVCIVILIKYFNIYRQIFHAMVDVLRMVKRRRKTKCKMRNNI